MTRTKQGSSLVLASILALAGGALAAPAVLAQGTCSVILDSLGNATPETVFSAHAGGVTLFRFQYAGVQFTLTRQVTLREIGGFISECGGLPDCSGFVVQIWRAISGLPSTSDILASFPLSSDGEASLNSYESAQIRYPLGPGTYFAMIVPVGLSEGFIVSSTVDPFSFEPEQVQMVTHHPGIDTVVFTSRAGFRILADCTIAVRIDVRPGGGPNQINPRGNGLVPVAVLSTAGFDASTTDPATVRFGATGTEAAPERYSLEHVDADGRLDLLLHFRSRDMGLTCATRTARLSGETFAGEPIEGSDAVTVLGCQGRR